MGRDEIARELTRALGKLGVSASTCGISKVPACVRLDVVVHGEVHKVEFRTGITRPELEFKLGALEAIWRRAHDKQQVDLEDAIRDAPGR
jgi:hypothetical protein